MSIKLSLHIPIKFSHIYHKHIHISLTQIFHNAILSKSKPKFIQQHHKLPTLSKFHKPPTLSKLQHDQRKNNTSRMIQSQHFQTWSITQCPQNFKITKWQYLTMKLSMKHATTFFQKKKKTHLGVYMTIWSMGPSVLKKSIIIIPLKCWIIFLTMKRKKRRSLEGRSHFDANKMGLENGFHQNGCVIKMLKIQGSKEILIGMDEGRLRSL